MICKSIRIYGLELFFFELCDAVRADVFTVNNVDIFCVAAEYARRLILLEHDVISINKDLNWIMNVDIQIASEFDRKYDSSELVDFSYNSGCFHVCSPFSYWNYIRKELKLLSSKIRSIIWYKLSYIKFILN